LKKAKSQAAKVANDIELRGIRWWNSFNSPSLKAFEVLQLELSQVELLDNRRVEMY